MPKTIIRHTLFVLVLLCSSSTAVANASRVIIGLPSLTGTDISDTDSANTVAPALQRHLQDFFHAQSDFVVLEGDFPADQQAEPENLRTSAAPPGELARVGNSVGADLVVMADILSLTAAPAHEMQRTEFNAHANVVIIEAATGSLLYSETFHLIRIRLPGPDAYEQFAATLADQIQLSLASHFRASAATASGPDR